MKNQKSHSQPPRRMSPLERPPKGDAREGAPPDRHVASRARACLAAFRSVADEVFFSRRPADRSLAAFFRRNRNLGSRDRRFIMEAVYAGFRWWGATRTALGERSWQAFEQRFSTLADNGRETGWPSAVEAGKCLAWALSLDGLLDSPEARALAEWAWPDGPPGGPPDASALAERADDLVPAWCYACLPEDTSRARLLAWLQQRPPMWLRLQTPDRERALAKLAAEGLAATPHERLPDAVSVGHPRVNLYTLPSFKEGLYDVQDAASQVVGLVCRPQPGERWWDACAGAGGKSLQLAWLMQGKGVVVASDVRAYKLDDLRKRARRGGFPNIQCRAWDGKAVPAKRANFDGVLVDAPCTCSGTWRRNPAARWQVSPADVREMAERQVSIVHNACRALRPGGVLVYATCSMFERENVGNVARILESTDLALEGFANPLAEGTVDGALQVWPWNADCDAMFVARFRKPR